MAGGEEKRKGHERPADEAYEKKNTLNNLYLIAYLKMKKKKKIYFLAQQHWHVYLTSLEKYW